MIEHIHTMRVCYADTDVMGFLHHSNYLRIYETARWEMFRAVGISYKEIEADGYLFPVVAAQVKYIKPAKYDDELTIYTKVKHLTGARCACIYKMYNEQKELINKAEVEMVMIEKQSKIIVTIPEYISNKLLYLV